MEEGQVVIDSLNVYLLSPFLRLLTTSLIALSMSRHLRKGRIRRKRLVLEGWSQCRFHSLRANSQI